MATFFADVLTHLATHANSLNEKVLSHVLRMSALEARKTKLTAPLPVLGVWDWDLTNDLAYLDPTCAQMFGVEANKGVSSAAWLPAIHPDDVALVGEEIQKTFK